MNKVQIKVYRPQIIPALVSSFFPFLFYILLAFWVFFATSSTIGAVSGLTYIIIIIIISLLLPIISLKFHYYELREDGVFIRKGIIAKSRGTLLYSQIQDVHAYQSLFARIFRVVDLQVKTMSFESGNLLYLSKEDANEIKKIILSKIRRQKGPYDASQITSEQLAAKASLMPYKLHPFKSLIFPSIFIVGILIFAVASFWLGFEIPDDKEPEARKFFMIGFLSGGIFVFYLLYYIFILYDAIATYKGFKYYLTKDFFEINYYFISKADVRVPYNKIQDVITYQSFTERILNLSSLLIETGEKIIESRKQRLKHLSSHIPFLNKNDAFSLRNTLLILTGIGNTNTTELRSRYPLSILKPLKKAMRSTYYIGLVILLITIGFRIFFKQVILKELAKEGSEMPIMLDFFINNTWQIVIALILAYSIFKFIYEIFYYKSYYYADNEELLTLRKGVFGIVTLTIPYNKVQHIFVDQDFFDRIFGLWDVHLASAGTIGMELHIDGLKREHAEGLRNLLIQRTIYKGKTRI